ANPNSSSVIQRASGIRNLSGNSKPSSETGISSSRETATSLNGRPEITDQNVLPYGTRVFSAPLDLAAGTCNLRYAFHRLTTHAEPGGGQESSRLVSGARRFPTRLRWCKARRRS